MRQKNNATSRDQKKSYNISGQQMHPLGTKKNQANSQNKTKKYATSWDKICTQPLGTKQIMQPLGTTKIMQPLRTKIIHTTTWDQKNHTTSWDKKIIQHLGTKKITQPLSNFCQDILSLSQFTLV